MLKPPPLARPLLLALLLTACEQRRPGAVVTASPASMQQLEGTWLQAPEEQRGDTLVYRPNTYKFVPTQRRTGFRLGAYGRFEQYDLAPAGGLTGRPGTWTADGKHRLRIHLNDAKTPDYSLEILAMTTSGRQKVLTLRRLP